MPNAILLYGPEGTIPPRLPRSIALPCNAPAQAIHILGGLFRWGPLLGREAPASLIVRLHYADGQAEDHPVRSGVEFAGDMRGVEVPGPSPVFLLGDQRVRHLTIRPKRAETIGRIELIKGPDDFTSPFVMAVTVAAGE